MDMKSVESRFLFRAGLLIATYVLLGNARSIQPNPFIEGAVVAVNMIVPVVAGALFGRFCGLTVGLLGTTLNALTPAGSVDHPADPDRCQSPGHHRHHPRDSHLPRL